MTELREVEALESEWRALWGRCEAAIPFQSPDWLLPWLRHLYGGGRLWVMALRRGGRLAGVVPLFIWGYGGRPEVLRISLLGAGITDYLDALIEPESAAEGAAAAFAQIMNRAGEWHLCDFHELRAGSPLLRAAVPEELRWHDIPCGVCPVLTLPAAVDELHAGMDAKLRTDIRRAGNRVRAAGEARFSRATAEDLDEHLEALFELHAARWQNRHEQGVLSTGQLQAFHRDVAQRFLAAGMLRLYGLRLDGRWLAVQYNFAARGRAYAYLAGFDPEFARLSPGSVLLAHSIGEALAEGMREFDFLRKREAFKYLWGARDQVNRRLVLWHGEAVEPRAEVA